MALLSQEAADCVASFFAPSANQMQMETMAGAFNYIAQQSLLPQLTVEFMQKTGAPVCHAAAANGSVWGRGGRLRGRVQAWPAGWLSGCLAVWLSSWLAGWVPWSVSCVCPTATTSSRVRRVRRQAAEC